MANINTKKVAIFDMDGTLIDSRKKLDAEVQTAFAKLGVNITLEQASGDWNDIGLKYGFRVEEIYDAFNPRKSWFQSLREKEVVIYPETYNVLSDLIKRGIHLGLLTKSKPEYTQEKLDFFNLGRYFEHTLTINPKETSKDNAGIEIVNRFNPKTIKDVYFIGDKKEDVVPERAVREHFNGYELTTGGIYINRQGKELNNYPNISSLVEILTLI